ncbi:MAG: ankyrin repeat domain-containing protein [Kiritimatiellia bacterium]
MNRVIVRSLAAVAIVLGTLSASGDDATLRELMTQQRFAEASRLLDEDVSDIQHVGSVRSYSLLHMAARRNQVDIARKLIERGAPIDAQDEVGKTPVHEAVRFGMEDVALFLLDQGADPNLADNNSDTPLETALYFGYPAFAHALVRHGATVDVFTACAFGDVSLIRSNLAAVCDWRKNIVRETPSEGIIIRRGFSDSLRKTPGAYLGVYRNSPLHWAARAGQIDIARLLVDAGQSVNDRNSHGETPLHWASRMGQAEMAQFLLTAGAEVNASIEHWNITPLLTAAQTARSPETIAVLIKAGAEIAATDNRGENALHFVARCGAAKSVECAKLLVEAGVDVQGRNVEGRTPYENALSAQSCHENTALVDYLENVSNGMKAVNPSP